AGLVSVVLVYIPLIAVIGIYYRRTGDRGIQRALKYIVIIIILSSLTVAVPFNGDPDADGLRSSLEPNRRGYSPLLPDTDGDGTLDFEEDADDDGLTNLREVDLGSNMWSSDSDTDFLNDSAEVIKGTNPSKSDTDGDGFDDNVEIEMDTNPLNADTDGDGTLDSNETYTETVRSDYYNVTVEITGKGNIRNKVGISRPANVMFTKYAADYYLSEAVQIYVYGSFDHANVTFSYNESEVENESTVTVFAQKEVREFSRGNPARYKTLVPEHTVDKENNTVTAHFETFEEIEAIYPISPTEYIERLKRVRELRRRIEETRED
ncbi:MAG: hypothetical protein SXQ77_12250, partial [Halobacteria archaeon]|nr:hypothetical protein [Halobacteria archaeon]